MVMFYFIQKIIGGIEYVKPKVGELNQLQDSHGSVTNIHPSHQSQ
jgi:hypothetical protein